MSNLNKPKEHFVSASDLAKVTLKQLKVADPVVNTNKTGHSWTTSDGYYIADGEKFDFLFELNPQQTFGINGKWPMEIKQEDQTMDNIEGLQICYPLTSLETVKNPTKNEEILMKFLKDVMWKKCADTMIEFNERDLIDGPAANACNTALKKKNTKIRKGTSV